MASTQGSSGSLPPTIPSLSDRCMPRVGMRNCGLPDNPYTQCLKKEAGIWERIASDPVFSVMKLPARYRLLELPPFYAMPTDATRLNQTGAIGPFSTLTAGIYEPIVSYLVPPGFDGVINSFMCKFALQTGPGLQDGSGMIQWVVQINNYLQLNYTDITMQQGDVTTLGPMPFGGGIRIKSNDLIQMFAIISPAGAAFLDPAGLIIGALQGWIYAAR